MTIRVGINGFGRIGRMVFRATLEHPEIDVVAVNDLTNAATLAHLLKYDSVHGIWPGEVRATEQGISVAGREIVVYAEPDPAKIPWAEHGVQLVMESTGRFTDRVGAEKHLQAGAKKVLISAPGKNEDATIVLGVNEEIYDPASHHVISAASCTTNCLAPVAKVIHNQFGIVRGMMTTIHSYTNDQQILDLPHKDLRRARAAALSIIPTTTGAAKAVSLVLPELKGRLHGMAMRVPTPNVSVVDLVVQLGQQASKEDLNRVLKEAAEGELKGIMAYNEVPLVSADYNGNPHSSIVDGLSTIVVDDMMAKIVAWYDNEWGYSNRVVDTLVFMDRKGF